MRNSLMPLFGVMITALIAVYALRGESLPGLNGPDIFPGIFRLPKKDKFPIISAPLTCDNQIVVEGLLPPSQGESWRTVQISARDRGAMTRSVVLALAEQLTKHGCIALVDPAELDPFPIGCDRVIGVSTTELQVPSVLGGDGAATLVIDVHLARLPQGHPAQHLQRDPGGAVSGIFTLKHHSHAIEQVSGWPQWWAGCSRAIAKDIIVQLTSHGLPPVINPETKQRLSTLLPLSDWGTVLNLAPTTEHLSWDYAFQDELVRGWVGHITGMQVLTKKHGPQPSVAQLEQVMVSGAWETVGAEGTRMFMRKNTKNNDQQEWFSFTALPQESGWSVVWWQERPGIQDIFEQWGKDAAAGNQTAQRQLYEYRACTVMPAELRERAQIKPQSVTAP